MNTSELVQPRHLDRNAMIYVRQSSPSQVLTSKESQRMRYAPPIKPTRPVASSMQSISNSTPGMIQSHTNSPPSFASRRMGIRN